MQRIKRYSIILSVALLLVSCSIKNTDSLNSSFNEDISNIENENEFCSSVDIYSSLYDSIESSESSDEIEKKQYIISFNDTFCCDENFAVLDETESCNYLITNCLTLNGEFENEAIFAFYTSLAIESVMVFSKKSESITKGIFIGHINPYGIYSLYKSDFLNDFYYYSYPNRVNAVHIAIRTVETAFISKIVLTLKNT